MIRTRPPLALLLAVALLLPGEVHVLTGGCLPGMPVAGAEVQARHHAPSSHPAERCAAHHHAGGPMRGGMQHCSAPGTCTTGVALLEPRTPLRESPAVVAAPLFVPTLHAGPVAPPSTPPPRL